ncbi:MAG: hypothetical protein KDC78_11475 [Aequorivita sp.]|nr:hypothetical protein [Aequorivita sp.]
MKTFNFIMLLIPFWIFGQIGTGTISPKGMLDITSSDSGLVIPRVTSIETVTDGNGNNAVDGTVVYDESRDQICLRIDGSWICTCYDSGSPTLGVTHSAFSANTNYIKASNTEAGDQFGYAVSISEDGTRLAVSATSEDSNATGINGNQSNNSAGGSGAVYIFFRNGTIWTQEAYIKASNTEAFDGFGYSMKLSGDGTRLAVSAPFEDSDANGVNGNQADNSAASTGAVYVFSRSGTIWTQEAYLKASNSDSPDNFGNGFSSVSINSDGSRIAVGAYREGSNATGVNGNQANNSASNSGAVYVFSRTGTTWIQEAYIKASNTGVDDYFGHDLDLSGDGTRLAVGASQEQSNATGINGNQGNNSANRAGAVYVYRRSGTTWTQEAYIKASNTRASNLFGNNMSFDYDGSRLAVCAAAEDSPSSGINGSQTQAGGLDDYGAVYIFSRNGTTWVQEAYVKASNPDIDDEFGATVSLSKYGFKLAVGSRRESSNATGINGNQSDNSANVSGAAYVFKRCGTTWVQESYVKASNTELGDYSGIVDLSANGLYLALGASGESSNAIGINGNQSNNSASQSGAVYIIE